MAQSSSRQAGISAHAPVSYAEARKRLIARRPKMRMGPWLMLVGAYWADRWNAEDYAIGRQSYSDVIAAAARDRMTEQQFASVEDEAHRAMEGFLDDVRPASAREPRTLWALKEMLSGPIGAVGIVVTVLLAGAMITLFNGEPVAILRQAIDTIEVFLPS